VRRALAVFILLVAASASAAIPPDLAKLTEDIERFPATKGTAAENVRLAKFFDLFWAARMREFPELAMYIGYAGVDDRLPDFSPEMLALEHRLPHLELKALDSIDRSGLAPSDQLNYDLARRRFQMEIEGERFHGLDPFHNDYILVDQMSDRIAEGLGLAGFEGKTLADYEHRLARLHGFPRLVEQGIARLDAGLKLGITPPRVTLRRFAKKKAVDASTADPEKNPLLDSFRAIPDTIPAADRARLKHDAYEALVTEDLPAWQRYRSYLADVYVPHARESISVSAMPDGKAWYAYLLRYFTTTDRTPEQLHELGLSEVKRIHGEMEKVIASTGFKGTFQEFCTFLRTDPRFFFDKPEDLVAAHREIAKRIDPELIRLFGRLPRLPYGIQDMGGTQEQAPSAYFDSGSLAQGRPGWMYINTFNLKARPKWAMESLTAHESVPGHHLQYALVEELTNLPEWRRWDVYPVFSEGWGLYAESLGDELGLYKDPYSKFGQLDLENWRAIRLVVDTGIHAMGWTRQQALDYVHATSAKTDLEIENEVDRYISKPGSVPCYKVGAMKIQELRRYAEKELGAKFDVRAFHDRILSEGQLPLDILESRIKEWVRQPSAVSRQPVSR
jgi:uncharacterized protein (DUF885 family)